VLDTTSLSDVDAEFALVGAFLAWPGAILRFGQDIEPDWFTDDSARAFYVAARRSSEDGEVTRESVLGHLPDSANASDPLTLKRLFAALVDRATVETGIPGVLGVVRDRWARRSLKGTCEITARDVRLHDTDVFGLAEEVAGQAERILGSRKLRMGGSVETGTAGMVASLRTRAAFRQFTTGLRSFDAKIGGYRAGQLYVIAGRPAMGKSAFGISTLTRSAQAGHTVFFCSLEMPEEEVAARILSDVADDSWAPAYGWIMGRRCSDDQIAELQVASDSVSALPMYLDYSPSLTLRDIAARARKERAKLEADGRKLDILAVDHLTCMAPNERYRGNPVMEVSENINGLRVLAKELDCAVVVLCQLSREVEKRDNKRPQLSDLRWTGEIEQAAHVVAFVYRDEYYLMSDPDADRHALAESRNVMELLVRKNRQGETGDVRLWCDMAHSSVRDPK
jgi:replicative DNA helicase